MQNFAQDAKNKPFSLRSTKVANTNGVHLRQSTTLSGEALPSFEIKVPLSELLSKFRQIQLKICDSLVGWLPYYTSKKTREIFLFVFMWATSVQYLRIDA